MKIIEKYIHWDQEALLQIAQNTIAMNKKMIYPTCEVMRIFHKCKYCEYLGTNVENNKHMLLKLNL